MDAALEGIKEALRAFLLAELKTRDLGTLPSLKAAVTGQTHETRADSVVLMWPEARKPLHDMQQLLDSELEHMTQLELDVSKLNL